jgi:hypothetical protein
MRSLPEALGGRLLAVLTLLLVPPLLAAGAHATAEAASPPGVLRAPIDDPMTGLLPACPAQLFSFSQKDVWVEDDPLSNFSTHSEAGLEQNCAWQNMQDRSDSNLWPRGVTAVAEPNTISINDDPTTVTLRATPSTATGPFNTAIPDCMPLSSRPGGCSDTTSNPALYVAYRLANGSGVFVGKWTHAGLGGPNPYFDLTDPSCPDNYPGWDSNYPHTGLPCTWELNFNTNVNGAPILTSAMQVVIAVDWLTGTKTVSGHTGYDYGYEAVVPMLFTPGGSTELSLGSLPSSVPHGTQVTLTADAVGPAAGTVVSFFRKPPGGAATLVGQDTTDAGGEASLVVTATGNAEYYASLSAPALESSKRALGVTRVLGMKKIKKLEGRKVKITGTVDPGAIGKVQLQLKGKKGWSTKKTANAKETVTWTLKAPKGKSTWRIVSVATADFLESLSKSKSVTVPAD